MRTSGDRSMGALSLALLIAACGGGGTGLGRRLAPSTHMTGGAELRVVTTGDTARSAFHDSTRLVSLGDAGFVAAAPTSAMFFTWEGAALGEVPLQRGFWLAGRTADDQVLVVEPPSGPEAARTVFALAADGTRTPRDDIDASTAVHGWLSPNEAAFLSRGVDALEIAPASGGESRRLVTLYSGDPAFAWAPDVGHVAVIDSDRGVPVLYVVDPQGRRGTNLLSGEDLVDNPGGALAWRWDDQLVVRRGGGTFRDSQIVQVRIGPTGGRVGAVRTLLEVPGSVSSIAAFGARFAFVSVTSHRTLEVASLPSAGALGSSTILVEGDYVRPLGTLSDGRTALITRDEPGGSWVVHVAHDGRTDIVLRIAQDHEVVGCTDGQDGIVYERARTDGGFDLVRLSSAGERVVPLAAELAGRLGVVTGIACAGSTCVLRSSLRGLRGVMLEAIDLETGATRGSACMLHGIFGRPNAVGVTADGTRAVLPGTIADADRALSDWFAGVGGPSGAMQAVSRVDLATCAGERRPLPGVWAEYVEPQGDDIVVSGEVFDRGQWGLWRVGAGDAATELSVGPDRLNRPFVTADGASLVFGHQHVTASVMVWSAPTT